MKHIGTSMFETERLLCRRFEENDLNDMFINWASDPMVQHMKKVEEMDVFSPSLLLIKQNNMPVIF